MRLQITKIVIFVILNLVLVFLLYNIPIRGNVILENICLYKNVFKTECWNCGMTRAFLSVIQGEFEQAVAYNWKVIFVFPLICATYMSFLYRNIMSKEK